MNHMASILIADDSDAIRQVLIEILEMGEHKIIGEAMNGEEAVSKFSELKPDVLLLDIAMPKKDGITVVKEIMANHTDAKILLITATDDQNVINECMSAGATGFISKPFTLDDVLKTVSDYLGN